MGLVLSLGVENEYPIQEPIKFSRSGPVLSLVATQPLYIGHGVVRLPLLVVAFGDARLI
jgi:hypothetical protein